ncbi:MAG: hypothetical protein RLZZ400_940 [Actinomycetota bacterium]
MPASFGESLHRTFASHGQLCIGLDPHAEILESWGLTDDANGLESFSMTVLDQLDGKVGIIKPQVAFYERFGSSGYGVLERVLKQASEMNLLVIADAKRGDIGSTMIGYLDAWLGRASSLPSSALTVSPFLGLESITTLLNPFLERGKGIFALVATSNPEGASVQTASTTTGQLDESLFSELDRINSVTAHADHLGSLGVVVGATLSAQRLGFLRNSSGRTPILAPGFGAQGARLEDVTRVFGEASKQVIATVSRSVLEAGPHGLGDAIDRAQEQLRTGLED